MRFVFISEGDLFLKEAGRDASEIESPFARESLERATVRANRNSWKGQGREDADMYSAGVVWGRQAGQRHRDHPLFRHVVRGVGENELIYALAMSASSGLFRYDLGTQEERRLFHRQDFDACGISCHRPTGELVLASRNEDDIGKLELYQEGGRRQRLTAGEGHDANPCHDPADPGRVYFQSSGVARDERGQLVAFGPVSIQRLDTKSGEMTTVLEDEHWDYLQPRPDAAGNLYFIRRPYSGRDDLPLGQKIKGFLLVPFHLLAAVFGFLDAFSRMFAKRSLRPAGASKEMPLARSRYATFHDTTLTLEKILNKQGQLDDSTQLVPPSWELVRRSADGTETTLARHVVAYDLGPGGELIYSDGLRVWQHAASPMKLFSGKIVQAVALV
jgi:hypothetical protein